MKARKVKGLDPDGPLADNARRIVSVRLDELRSFVPRALDPDEVEALHDMRIAAKRLRYVLEIAGPAFGRPASDGAKVARKLQDLLGEIHDCDVMLPRVSSHESRLRAQDAEALRRAGEGDRDLPPAAARRAPNRSRYRGLEALTAYLTARRAVLFERFVRDWERLEARSFAAQLLEALGRGAQPDRWSGEHRREDLSPTPPAPEAERDGAAP